MGKVRIKFHYKGFNELRKQASVEAAVRSEAVGIAKRAAGLSGLTWGINGNADFVVYEFPDWKTRARFTVVAASNAVRVAEARDGVLTKALRG